jgi:hypothetical protein
VRHTKLKTTNYVNYSRNSFLLWKNGKAGGPVSIHILLFKLITELAIVYRERIFLRWQRSPSRYYFVMANAG